MSSALATAISVGVLGFCMSIRWAKMTVDCASGNNTFFNGSATLNLDLFEGVLERSFCPFFLPEATFQGNSPRSKCDQYYMCVSLSTNPKDLKIQIHQPFKCIYEWILIWWSFPHFNKGDSLRLQFRTGSAYFFLTSWPKCFCCLNLKLFLDFVRPTQSPDLLLALYISAKPWIC